MTHFFEHESVLNVLEEVTVFAIKHELSVIELVKHVSCETCLQLKGIPDMIVSG